MWKESLKGFKSTRKACMINNYMEVMCWKEVKRSVTKKAEGRGLEKRKSRQAAKEMRG